MGPKRRKTGSAALASVKQSDQEKSIAAALCERLVRCQDENGHDLSRDDFQVDVDANIPANIRLGAHQAAIILQGAITELQTAIDTAAILGNSSRAPVASTVDQAKELVAYAHRLSFTTSAPPGFVPGQTPLLHFKPPAPQDIQLRSSALHQFQREYELRIKEGERAVAYSAEKKATTKPALPPAGTAEPKHAPTAAASLNLAGILRTLPPMPAGWKPGDPIPGLVDSEGAVAPTAAAGVTIEDTTPISVPISSAASPPPPQQQGPTAVPITAPVAAGPRPIAAFDFALNPDMELEFDVGDSSDSDDDGSDSD
ncbi:hypothetical protein Ndes2526B_g06317 [Nannochloris sp. 'desiccata']|nr:putative Mediator of RNA polymerase II transcription subunit 4 [Chlorella desiccata (nom. nud.)]